MRLYVFASMMLCLACGAPAREPPAPTADRGEDRQAGDESAGATATHAGIGDPDVTAADGGTRITHAETEEECRRCNGRWGPRGITGIPGCVCPTADGGKPCRSPRDCEHRCYVDWQEAVALGRVRCAAGGDCEGGVAIPEGRCAEDFDIFGCRAWIMEQPTADGPVLTIFHACVD